MNWVFFYTLDDASAPTRIDQVGMICIGVPDVAHAPACSGCSAGTVAGVDAEMC